MTTTPVVYGLRVQFPEDHPICLGGVVGINPDGKNFLIEYAPDGSVRLEEDLGVNGLNDPQPWMSYTDKGGFEEITDEQGRGVPVYAENLKDGLKGFQAIESYLEKHRR